MPAPPSVSTAPRGRRRRSALLTLALLLPAVLLSAAPRAAADPNLVTNPGFETAGSGDMPYCWSRSGWGDNEFVIQPTTDAHGGSTAMEVTLTERLEGDRKALITESAECAPFVEEGHQYDLSLWYKATTGSNSVTIFRHDTTLGWQYWTDVQTLGPAAAYTYTEVRTPEIPPGTDRIAWGVSLYAVGTLITDDYSMVDATVPDPGPVCTGTQAECEDGAWEVLPTENPVRSMHSVVLHNGKVLLIAGSGNSEELFAAGTFTSAVYDPADGSYTVIPTPDDMFCAGHVQLADGRVLVMSGNLAYPDAEGTHGYEGYKDSYIFDPATETYTKTNDMNDGHWYPSATILGNGDVLSFGGLREDSTGSVTAELWSHEQQQWLPTWQVNQTWSFWGLYPSMILMQDGRLFYSGSHVFGNGTPGTGASIYDYGANTITEVPGLQNKDERDQSASVLLPPAQDQKVITMGGGNIDTNPDANRLTDIIDLTQPDPAYEPGPLLPQGTVDLGDGPVPQTGDQGKMYVSAVLLPDGTVLETGGGLHNRADPVYESSIFDPVTETFDPVAPNPEAYGYHSSAFLLPDGRVMATGDNPGDGSWNHNVSIYSPPYLFRGDRPQITSVAATEWDYGSTQQITVDSPIVKAELIRPAAVTHSSDPNQRFVDLPLTVNGSTIDLNVTSNPNLAPPGWYMLFAVNADGVPSIAEWVHLGVPESGTMLSATTTGHDHGAMTLSGTEDSLSTLSTGTTGTTASPEEDLVPAVQDFAGSLTGEVRGPEKRRESEPVDVRIAGCERAYGAADVCVPTAFPPKVADTTRGRCAWLRQHDFGRLELNGTEDPLRLDRNGDGLACGKGDVPKRYRLT